MICTHTNSRNTTGIGFRTDPPQTKLTLQHVNFPCVGNLDAVTILELPASRRCSTEMPKVVQHGLDGQLASRRWGWRLPPKGEELLGATLLHSWRWFLLNRIFSLIFPLRSDAICRAPPGVQTPRGL